jgi:hypothetical protein
MWSAAALLVSILSCIFNHQRFSVFLPLHVDDCLALSMHPSYAAYIISPTSSISPYLSPVNTTNAVPDISSQANSLRRSRASDSTWNTMVSTASHATVITSPDRAPELIVPLRLSPLPVAPSSYLHTAVNLPGSTSVLSCHTFSESSEKSSERYSLPPTQSVKSMISVQPGAPPFLPSCSTATDRAHPLPGSSDYCGTAVSIIFHDDRVAQLFDEYNISWMTQISLAQGVQEKKWRCEDITACKVSQLIGPTTRSAQLIEQVMRNGPPASDSREIW